jgi:hypothetical protein
VCNPTAVKAVEELHARSKGTQLQYLDSVPNAHSLSFSPPQLCTFSLVLTAAALHNPSVPDFILFARHTTHPYSAPFPSTSLNQVSLTTWTCIQQFAKTKYIATVRLGLLQLSASDSAASALFAAANLFPSIAGKHAGTLSVPALPKKMGVDVYLAPASQRYFVQ